MSGEENNTNLLAGLNQLIKAVNDLVLSNTQTVNASCPPPVTNVYVTCTSTGAGGETGPGGGPIIEPPPIEPGEPGEVPPGFPEGYTYNDYLAYKCRAANRIVDDLIGTCVNMSSLGGALGVISGAALYAFINTSLLSGVLVGVMAIGFSAATAAAIIIATMVAIVAEGVGGFLYFSNLATALDGQHDDLVCLLFTALSVEAARSDFEAAIDDAITGLGIGETISDQLNTIVLTLCGYAVYNYLWTYDAEIAEYVGTSDCQACEAGECSIDYVAVSEGFGDIVSDSTEYGVRTLVINSELSTGAHRIWLSVDQEIYPGCYYRITAAEKSAGDGSVVAQTSLYPSGYNVFAIGDLVGVSAIFIQFLNDTTPGNSFQVTISFDSPS
jgi:hypothetical protein